MGYYRKGANGRDQKIANDRECIMTKNVQKIRDRNDVNGHKGKNANGS